MRGPSLVGMAPLDVPLGYTKVKGDLGAMELFVFMFLSRPFHLHKNVYKHLQQTCPNHVEIIPDAL